MTERSLPIAWEIAPTKNPKPINIETHPYLFESDNNEPVDFEVAASKRLEPINITAQAPFCYGNFGFDGIAERTREQLKLIPTNRLRRIAANEFAKRFHSKKSKNPERSANIYLRETVKRVKQITDRSPLTVRELNSKKHRKEKAEQLALISQQMCIVDFDESTTLEDAEQLVFACYIKAHDFALSQGVTPPYQSVFNKAKSKYHKRRCKCEPCDTDALANKLERGIRRMTCEKWWMRKLNTLRDMTMEHLNITMGQVNKKVSAYASYDAVREFKGSKRSQADWVNSMQLENEEGHQISLHDVFKGSVSNPEIRRIELMVRLRGYQEWADENGLIAMFYTITAPSKYHANSRKYNNASPKETQQYLVSQWAKVRASLARNETPFFGMRVAEPHADATPHWHMLAFMQPKDEKNITSTIKAFALEHDADEKGAAENRFDAEKIDPSKGSAVGYIAKYIAKNINASHIEHEIDYETGKPFARDLIQSKEEKAAEELAIKKGKKPEVKPRTEENWVAVNVATWASRWRIRQFQFFGGAPVGLWREFRRIDPKSIHKLNELAQEIFHKADNSRFAEFMDLLGGAFAKRSERPVGLVKDDEGQNDYGEPKLRQVGVRVLGVAFITRSARWSLSLKGSASASRSTGNNCTGCTDNRQIHTAGEFDPLLFIPPEIAGAVRKGAVYHEIDEELKQIKEFKFTSGGLSQSTAFY